LRVTDEGSEGMSRKNPHWGSMVDDFLREEGTRDDVRAVAVARVAAWRRGQEMTRQGLEILRSGSRESPECAIVTA
jgi:hypothetical protein